MENQTLSQAFLVGVGIQRSILNAFGDVVTLGGEWDVPKFIEAIKSDPGVKNEFDIYKLSDQELIGLGFGKISDECNIRLIPSWLYPFLPDQLFVYGKGTPKGIVIPKKKLGVPRMGYFGLGILAKGMPILNSEKVAITPDKFTENDVRVD